MKKISFKKMSDFIGETVTRADFDRYFADRIHWYSEDQLWICGYMKEQYKTLSSKNKAHVNMAKQVVTAIGDQLLSKRAASFFDPLKTLIRQSDDHQSTLDRGSEDPQERDIGNRKKETGKNVFEGGVGGAVTPEDLLCLWNEHGKGLLPAEGLDPDRRARAIECIRDVPDPERLKKAIQKIAASPYCTGENESGWVADFDFLVKPGTVFKALEGKYRGVTDEEMMAAVERGSNNAENYRS